jgi:competence protein ComEC
VPPLGFVSASSFILGVAVFGTDYAWPVLIILSGIFVVASVLLEDYRWLLICGLAVLSLGVGMIRVSGEGSYSPAPRELTGARQFSGLVATVPRSYPQVTYATIDLDQPSSAQAWAELPPYPRVRQGDRVTVRGNFRSFETTPYRGFAAQRETQGVLYADQITVIGNEATAPQRFRNYVADQVRDRVQHRVPEPAGAFTVGMLLGDDGAMTEATRHNFRVGGMTHMTAVSGLHVGIIAGAILLLGRMGLIHRWWLLGASLPLIWTFAYVVGMRPSVVRASLMFTLLILALFLGRPRDTINAVGIASALMILVDPAIRLDIGFQLSVAATAGIALGVLLIGDRSPWHAVWVVPLSAEIAVEPLILHHFGYYSLVSPVANIAAAPFVALAMALGILTVVVSLLNEFLADVVGVAAWVPSRAVVLIADTAAQIPFLSGEIEPLGLTGVLVAYIIICGVLAVLYVLIHPAFGDREGDVGTLYRI